VNVAEQLIQEGFQKGLAEGRAEGLAKGLAEGLAEGRAEGRAEAGRTGLLKLLTKRFGPLPEDAVARVKSADEVDLDRWLDRSLTAPTLAEVLE
jgi:flagellar biosynthesis/type III secretory pathway protein FliH